MRLKGKFDRQDGARLRGVITPMHGRSFPVILLLSTVAMLLAPLARAEPGRDGFEWQLSIDHLEWQDSTPPDAVSWDIRFSAGSDSGGLRIRNKGGRHVWGAARNNRLEVLWGQRLHWWNWAEALDLELQLGVRHDSGTTPTRTYGAAGFTGRLPLDVEIEAAWYLGEGSREGDDLHSGVWVQVQRRWELTDRLALVLRAEHEAWSEDHVRYSEGSGPWMSSAGARMHYRFGDRIAPYVGVEWFDLVGDTASQAVAAGEAENEVRAVVGLRMEFGGG
jgi:copper resistance protein B